MNKGIFRVLSTRSFFFLFLSEIFTQIPTNMLNFILIIAVYRLTTSSTAVSGIVLSFSVPAVFLGIIAGVYVDRMHKKRVLLATNILRGLLLILVAFSFNNLALLYILSFLIFSVTQFFIPAETPIIPHVVRQSELLAANALFGIALYISLLLAYGLSSPFYFVFGPQYVFIALAILFFIGGFFVLFIKVKTTDQEIHEKMPLKEMSIIKEMRRTAKLITNTREVLRSLLLLTFFQVIILLIAVIGPGYAKQILHIPVSEFPLVLVTPSAIGMLLGAFIIGHYCNNIPREKIATIGLFITGIATFFLPFANSNLFHGMLHIMILLAFILGIGGAFIFVPSNTILQEKTSDQLRGKIYGFLNAVVGAFSIIPIIAVGGLSDILGVGTVLIGMSIIILGIALIRTIFL